MNFRVFIVEMSVHSIWGDVCLHMSGAVPCEESLPYVNGIFVTVQNLGLY